MDTKATYQHAKNKRNNLTFVGFFVTMQMVVEHGLRLPYHRLRSLFCLLSRGNSVSNCYGTSL